MTETCTYRTLKGGGGVDNAGGVREYACGLPKGHSEPCDYTREVGEVTTAESCSGGEGRRMDVEGVKQALGRLDSACTHDRLLGLPLGVLDGVQSKIHAVQGVFDAFGPRSEIIGLVEDIITEVERWASSE